MAKIDFIPPIPVMQIRPGCILFYDQYIGPRRSRNSGSIEIHSPGNEQKMYAGKMNEKAKSKLRFAVNLLVEQAKWKEVENPTTKKLYKFKINFITLTLSAPQKDVTDRTIKSKMLAPWIRTMRDSYGLRSYVWRAERQKNGNIHFHFSTDTYINYDSIRDCWNNQQGKFHFIADFQNRNKSQYPNSTDVHSVRSIKNLASYLVKYMAKDEKGLESIDGKVWDCSDNLKTSIRVGYMMDSQDFALANKLFTTFSTKALKLENCSIIPMTKKEMRNFLPTEYFTDYQNWLQSVYDAAVPSRIKRVSKNQISRAPPGAKEIVYKSPF